MSEGKRYYWLKLRDDFFASKRIKKLRRLAGGDTYTIIYLKMQLKALKTDGVLEYTGVESTFADEIALDLDENPEDVKVTLSFLLANGLAEAPDDISLALPYVWANTGSETASTQRVRDYRERQRALHCNTDVTQVKRLCNAEIEKEKEIEIEKDLLVSKETNRCTRSDVQRIVTAWNATGFTPIRGIKANTNRGALVRKRVNDYGVDEVLRGIENARNSAFLSGDNRKGWQITFDWFIRPGNFQKVIEGNYADKAGRSGNPFMEIAEELEAKEHDRI